MCDIFCRRRQVIFAVMRVGSFRQRKTAVSSSGGEVNGPGTYAEWSERSRCVRGRVKCAARAAPFYPDLIWWDVSVSLLERRRASAAAAASKEA